MTKTMKRFLKIRNGINSGKYDEMKLYDFFQSLNAKQARLFMQEVYDHCIDKNEGKIFCHTLTKCLREDVVKELIREDFQSFADMGFCSLIYDNNGNIDAIHIEPEQAERLLAFQKFHERR